MSDTSYLVKVQTYDDVGPLRLLIYHFQEVNMADVCGGFAVKAKTIPQTTAKPAEQFSAFLIYGYGRGQRPQPRR